MLISAPQTLRASQLVLRDALGRQVPTQLRAGPNGTVQLNLSANPSGMYLLQVELNGRRYHQKVVR